MPCGWYADNNNIDAPSIRHLNHQLANSLFDPISQLTQLVTQLQSEYDCFEFLKLPSG